MNNKLKIVTLGGGSSYTPELVEGFIQRYNELPISELWLVDIKAGVEKLDIIGNLAKRMIEKAGLPIEIHTTLDRRLALPGADFVTTQFRVGGITSRIKDERIPLKYDCIGQETTGPGGFANALRTIPVILDVCRDMEELCPNAWLINFSNPSGIITETILNHSKIRAIGLCNGPVGMMSEIASQFNCEINDVYCDFVGLNHLLWAQKILVKDQDVTSQVIANAHQDDEIMKNIPNISTGSEFYKSLGMLPIGYLKYYYLTKEMLIECQKDAVNQGVRGEVVGAVENELFNLYRDPNLNIKPPQLAKRGGAHYSDAACDLINSIYNDKQDIQVVNIKNQQTTLDLPANAVIERNCIITKEGPKPLPIGNLPLKVRGLIQLVKSYEQLTIQAGVNGDKEAALQALTLHPLVPSANIAKELLEDLIAQNIEYLPQFR